MFLKDVYTTIKKKIYDYKNEPNNIKTKITDIKNSINKILLSVIVGGVLLLSTPGLEKNLYSAEKNNLKKYISMSDIEQKNTQVDNMNNYKNIPHGIAKKGQSVSEFVNNILNEYSIKNNEDIKIYKSILKKNPRYWHYLINVNTGEIVYNDKTDLKAGQTYAFNISANNNKVRNKKTTKQKENINIYPPSNLKIALVQDENKSIVKKYAKVFLGGEIKDIDKLADKIDKSIKNHENTVVMNSVRNSHFPQFLKDKVKEIFKKDDKDISIYDLIGIVAKVEGGHKAIDIVMQAQNENNPSIKKSLINKAVDMLVHNTGDNGLFQQTKTFIDTELNNKNLDHRLKEYFGNVNLVKNNFYLKGLVREYLKKAVDEKKTANEILKDLSNIDVRFDVEKSSAIIAVNYIRVRNNLDIYKNISNEDKHNLALAIYNCGEGTGYKIANLMNKYNISIDKAMEIIKINADINNKNIHLNPIDAQRRIVMSNIYDIKNKSEQKIDYNTDQDKLIESAKSYAIKQRLYELAENKINLYLKVANVSDELQSVVDKVNKNGDIFKNTIKKLEQDEKKYIKEGNITKLNECRKQMRQLYLILSISRREDVNYGIKKAA